MSEIRLKEISTKAPDELDKKEIKEKLEEILFDLNELQNLLYAEFKHSVLVVLQGMDASGKDGAVRNVFGKLNPMGVLVKSFKEPTEEELSHDFLWRVHKVTPGLGKIQIFNRSHYEDVLATRVHEKCNDKTAYKRMEAINDFEELLQEHNNTIVLKFFLHVSEKEQTERLKERIKDPHKQWKYNEKDLEEAKLRDKYLKMYEDVFRFCNKVPWIIVPADQNWYKEYLIASTLRNALKEIDMKYPGPGEREKNLHA